MAIKVVECLSWAATDRPGELLTFAEHFRDEGINLDALWGYVTNNNKARIAAIGKNPAKLKRVLKKLQVKADVCKGFYVSGKDKTGALIDIFKALSNARINIECADAMATQGKYAGTIWVSKSDFAEAKNILKVR